MSKYEHLDKGELLRLLERRDAERQLGLVWERDEIEADAAINDDFVALSLDEGLSFTSQRPGTGDRGPGTGDRGPGTGDRGPGTGDRGILMHILKVLATSLSKATTSMRCAHCG